MAATSANSAPSSISIGLRLRNIHSPSMTDVYLCVCLVSSACTFNNDQGGFILGDKGQTMQAHKCK